MNKTNKILFYVLTILVLVVISTSKPVISEKVEKETLDETISTKRVDPKTQILAGYLAKHNSPLQYHAQDFIDASNTYDLDWRLVAAISGVESTFGKFIPGGYNGWGWGVYGKNALYFKSWRDGIFAVSQGLRENYVNKGLKDPYSMNRIYATSPQWGWKVTYFMNDMQNFSDESDSLSNEQISEVVIPNTKVAVTSALTELK